MASSSVCGPKPGPKEEVDDGEFEAGCVYLREQRLLLTADDPEDTPWFNAAWMDSR
jgi:hypothetical protein